MNAPRRLALRDLGRIGYAQAWALQRELVAEAGARDHDLLLVCEHPEVVTTGRKAQGRTRDPEAELALVRAAGIEVVAIERGGAATWHGPGQLVGYPLVRLGPDERDLHAYLRALEQALIEALGELGLEAGRNLGWTGVWVGERKLASIGIACRGWVTYHGFALNLDVDLARFRLFDPCDLSGETYTSLRELGVEVERDALVGRVHAHLARELGRVAR
ncbi:MAG: lipoyl(octanoyl) transferase LipB [Planctomycetota bacterium]